MNNELLLVLDYIEREKGIEKSIIISAIESALLSAARKRFGEESDLSVTIEKATGEIKVLKENKLIKSDDFGRIAAQTAKQIITQKIREAERDVIFKEYQAKVRDITNGIVHRFEKGNIIVDLGKTEGVLSPKEILPQEEFKQGDRVRALILEVQRTGKGPQVILSRTHADFVKRLFELEVPEIYENIVEIKAISRKAGERTKVAVLSKDEKIDCVGACVGIRGARIKNIVRELKGEKVDIVRYSEDIKEYVKAALNPAKVMDIKSDDKEKKVDVVVDEENLSIAIGKGGQNVRLASKLVGWNINIKNKFEREEAAQKKEAEGEEIRESGEGSPIEQIKGIGKKTLTSLMEAGFDNLLKLSQAKVEQLQEIKGIGKKRAEQIIEEAKKLVE